MNFSEKDVGLTLRNDSAVSTRCMRTTLATLTLYMESQGHVNRSLSELVRNSLEGLEHMIRANNFEGIDDPSEATRLLTERGMGNLNIKGRGKKNLWNNLVFEDRKVEGSSNTTIDEMVKKVMDDLKKDKGQDIKEVKEALGMEPEGVVKEDGKDN